MVSCPAGIMIHRLVILVTILLPVVLHAAPLPPKSDIDRIVRPFIDQQWCNAIVVGLIDSDGRQIYGYGTIRDGASFPPDGNTVFEIGSVTKAFTGLLLAQMVLDKQVRLDDPVQVYLPPTVLMPQTRDRSPITLLQLATHHSGLPRMPPNFHPADPLNPYADYSLRQLHEALTLAALTPRSAPPYNYMYSNMGTGLLGQALALRAKKSYEDLVIEKISRPLHMPDTRITLNDSMRRRLAPGHDADGNPAIIWDIPALAGAGALRSTANDMLQFIGAQLTLAPTSLRPAIEATHVRHENADPQTDIALAWHITTATGVLWHNGHTGGHHAIVAFLPKKSLGVVILSNTATMMVDQLAGACLQLMQGRKVSPLVLRKAIVLKAEDLDQYTGEYVLPNGVIMTISHEGDKLWTQMPGELRVRLYPQTRAKFFCKAVDSLGVFQAGPDGKIARLIINLGGNILMAERRAARSAP